ncbi:heat-inducible transcriptional repressor HrcA [soil metagenome]
MNIILTDREKTILRFVVENYVRHAFPVGSRNVSKQSDLNLSSATIRNVMSDLEEMELLKTPHTSAGRVPTDKAYRLYVDSLMNREGLTSREKSMIRSHVIDNLSAFNSAQDIYNETSKLLGKISHLLAVVTEPFLSSGVFEKLELVQVSNSKILVVINLRSDIVKTVMMDIDSEISRVKIDTLNILLNERLSGLTLKEIRDTFSQRMGEYSGDYEGLVQVFINSVEKIYSEQEKGSKYYIGGTGEMMNQPEFEDPKNLKNLIELTENKNLVVHIFQNSSLLNDQDVNISIGKENEQLKLKDLSILTTVYRTGDVSGRIGVVGPKRMNYAKVVSLLEYTTKLISELSI